MYKFNCLVCAEPLGARRTIVCSAKCRKVWQAAAQRASRKSLKSESACRARSWLRRQARRAAALAAAEAEVLRRAKLARALLI